jgi:hypothetical protein
VNHALPRWASDPRRGLIALSLLAGVLSVIIVLDYGGFPNPPARYWISEYLARTQDLAGSVLLMALVLAACFAPARNAALGLAASISRHPWRTAGAAFVLLCLGTLYVEQNHPVAQDEYAALFQSKVFAAGRLTGEFPADLIGRLIPVQYFNQFFYGSFATGEIASAYWPGFALLLAPFSLAGVPWACNPLLAALALVLIGALAARLSGVPEARGWAMLLALASPAFGGMAITYFSMTAHLLLNLVFVWLLLERSTARLLLAGAVGSLALALHNPLPHALFAAPWIAWLAFGAGWRALVVLAAGYAPLALALGFGWPLLLSGIEGNALLGIFPVDGNPVHRVANFFWSWHVKLRTALAGPGDEVVAKRLAELVRLWSWAVPGLPLLAAAGWWAARRERPVLLLGLSLLCTMLGYLLIAFAQGFGWGARYLHPAWGALPVLAAVALARWRPGEARERLHGYVAALAVLSLVLATLLRASQIHDYLEEHLANRPPSSPGARQIVFVAMDYRRYTPDLVQNDPFLRDPVWYLASLGSARDHALLNARFPGARLVSEDHRGQVWQIDPR